MQYTPVVPPIPGAPGVSTPGRPPVIPYSPQAAPSWLQPQQFPIMSPFMGAHPMQGVPGSYFIPPVALPPQGAGSPVAPVGGGGFSADFTGFPNAGSPYSHPGTHPGSPTGSHPHTPFVAPGTGYSQFQQPLPPQYGGHPGMQMWPPMMQMFTTPYAMPGAMPGGMPGGWPNTPFAAPGATGLPPQGAAPPQQAAPPAPIVRPYDASEFDKVPKFAEGPHYGPVLEPILIKKVKARVELNPLLAPPPDEDNHDYIKWNMLFSTAQCQRSSDPAHRSWSNGRQAPATWPRVSSLRLISRNIPWPIEVTASDPLTGVTCGDVIEAIYTYMNGRVSQKQYDNASEQQKHTLSEAFYYNRSTAHGVPGGRLPQTLLRFDWLGQDTMFGGIVSNENFVKEVCGGALPCIFELKCMRRYPMTELEIQEQERREAEADAQSRARRRARSNRTSRATSRAATSRPPSRASSRHPDEDDGE